MLELQGTQSKREIQDEKFLPTVGFEPGTFVYEADSQPIAPRDLRITLGWNLAALKYVCYLPVPCGIPR